MGSRQSKRSVDITTTPKKEGIPAEGGVVGDAAAPGDGKLERIEETDTKPTTNGIAPHTDTSEDKDKDKDESTEKGKEKQQEDVKADETKQESSGESPAEAGEVTTPTEPAPASPNTATSPENKEAKKKDKMRKKWSFRSISFSKKDKSKPPREEAPKNGDVTKEEPLTEGGEEAENASAAASASPVEEKSGESSPSAEEDATATEAKEEPAAVPAPGTPAVAAATATVAAAAASSPTEEKKEEPTPSTPTPAPVEDKKEEVEKVEAEKKVVEVSRAGGQSIVDPVEVFRVQPVATPSIIERKTSEDIPSQPPSSPPPTPIDPSPLQQAQQAAANATALAEALKLPAEAADKVESITPLTTYSLSHPPSHSYQEQHDPPKSPRESCIATPMKPSSTDKPPADTTFVSTNLETLPVVDHDIGNPEISIKENLTPTNSADKEKVNVRESPAVDSDKSHEEAPDSLPRRSVSEEVEVAEIAAEVESEANKSDGASKEDRSNDGSPLVSEVLSAVKGGTENIADVKVDEKTEIPSGVSASVKDENVVDLTESGIPCSKSVNADGDANGVAVEKEAVIAIEAEELTDTAEIVAEPIEGLIQEVIEPSAEIIEGAMEEAESVKEEIVIDPTESATDLIIESEEGPIPVSEEILVEAKPAVVIPEDEAIEEIVDTDPDTSKVDTESVEVIPEPELDKVDNETGSDAALPAEEILLLDEPEDETIKIGQPVNETIVIVENVGEGKKDIIEVSEIEETLPPPLPKSNPPSAREIVDPEEKTIEAEPNILRAIDPEPITAQVSEIEPSRQPTESRASEKEQIKATKATKECSQPDTPIETESLQSRVSDIPMSSVSDQDKNLANESQTDLDSSRLENICLIETDLPAPPQDTIELRDSTELPLPPEELSCPLLPSNVSQIKNELPVAAENARSPRNPTEMLPTPPRSPSPRSNHSIVSGTTTSTLKDCSQTQLYDERSSNHEFKMESASISLNSYNESDIELKERLAESLTESTENQESGVTCQLSNTATSTAIQEIHQNTPESEAPVENNVAHEVSTTESSDEAPKVPPTVPSEAPASPPTAPAITEDVASVTKAIEEIDISDKAVAAATIECNTNEIIADAHHQNNINE